jgi:mycoredoxin
VHRPLFGLRDAAQGSGLFLGQRQCQPGGGAGNAGIARGESPLMSTVSATSADLIMYSTTWCGYCRRLKTQLDEAGIAYRVVDIEQDPAAAEFVGSVNGGNHVVPTLRFSDGSTATNPSLAEVRTRLAALA